ncbi:MAG: cysteine desulfurase NifS [Lachnospiraceae bacterium]|nr:cysteine desulfurase NifS [Lachnospiraceae bacterium]
MIYLDNAATAPMKKGAYEKMLPYLTKYYANPSGAYDFSKQSADAMDKAREQIASLIGADKNEIYFTSGGTESDNWAIKGTADLLQKKGRHIITTRIEHHGILNTCKDLEKRGYKITYLEVDEYGMIKMDRLKKSIRPDTVLISVMTANNEIGTIQPIAEIGLIAKQNGILFHTDAVQACGHIPIDVKKANIDMLSASAHKFGGPKGIGFLYIRQDIALPSFMYGGSQEQGRRAGTGNVASAVAMGEAADICRNNMKQHMDYVTRLREYAIQRILREIPFVRLNGHRTRRLPGNMNFSFQFVDGEALLVMLDMKGICASTGSACSTGSTEPSHVLMSIGLTEDLAHGSLRLTISEENNKKEIDTAIDEIKRSLFKLREMSNEYRHMVTPMSSYGKRMRRQYRY